VKCGTERWPVKTLSDDRAGQVDFTPRATSVDALRNLPDPQPVSPARQAPASESESNPGMPAPHIF
jgi:hypothetical protein